METGNNKNTKSIVEPGTTYINVPFQNIHAAMSSERAYEVSNRIHKDKQHRLDDSSVFHWLGLPKDAEGKDVEAIDGRKLNSAPDTCFILLGTNDSLSDYGDAKNSVSKNINAIEKALLDRKKGDMVVIANALRQANPKVKLVMLTIPTWYERGVNSTDKDFKAIVKTYNKKFATTFKKETVVDINQGLVDICSESIPYMGVKNFFHAGDKLHPTPQGDLIMAGLVARTMGLAGRSAGAPRKGTSDFSSSASALLARATTKEGVEPAGDGFTIKAGGKLESPWPEESEAAQGFTVELYMNVGNGASGGWEKEGNVVFSVGNGVHSGQLKLAEGYILWNNGTVLYPIDMSNKKVEPIRVMWVPGNADQHVAKGFYVWLGDMLIGEGLGDDGTKFNGVGVENVSGRDEVVKSFAADDKPSAPTTKGTMKEETLVMFDTEQPATPPAAPEKK